MQTVAKEQRTTKDKTLQISLPKLIPYAKLQYKNINEIMPNGSKMHCTLLIRFSCLNLGKTS